MKAVLFTLVVVLVVSEAQEPLPEQGGPCTTFECQQQALYQRQRTDLHEMRMDVFKMIQELQRSIHEEEFQLNELIRKHTMRQHHQQQQHQ